VRTATIEPIDGAENTKISGNISIANKGVIHIVMDVLNLLRIKSQVRPVGATFCKFGD